MNFNYGHPYLGEFHFAGKAYYLKEIIQTAEPFEYGKQTFNLIDVQTGQELQLDYLPNQRVIIEHEARLRKLRASAFVEANAMFDALEKLNDKREESE